MKDQKYNVKSKKISKDEIDNDPLLKKLAAKRMERLQQTREKLAKEPMPERKQEESKSEFIERTNPAYIKRLLDMRLKRRRDRKEDE